ncbi:hypothetical protein BDD12DRAFT_804450 [Trichophaea hybrida]|nr:hypothetical protein BDD12DRAFT_804450 [Trichophaea hybrida]
MEAVIGGISSVIAIATVTAQMTKRILEVIGSIKNTPTRLQQLSDELKVLNAVLMEVGGITGPEGHDGQSSIAIALKSCRKELASLEAVVTWYQSGEKVSATRRAAKEISEAIQRLQQHKNRECLALTTGIISKLEHTENRESGQSIWLYDLSAEALSQVRIAPARRQKTTGCLNRNVASAVAKHLDNPSITLNELFDFNENETQHMLKLGLESVRQLKGPYFPPIVCTYFFVVEAQYQELSRMRARKNFNGSRSKSISSFGRTGLDHAYISMGSQGLAKAF